METVNYTVSKIRSGTVSAFSVYFKYEVVKRPDMAEPWQQESFPVGMS